MSAARIDIDVFRGRQLPAALVLTLWTDIAKTVPYSLASCDVEVQIQNLATNEYVDISALFVVTDEPGGEITFDPTDTDTEALVAGTYRIVVSLTTAEPRKLPPLFEGSFTVYENPLP